MDSKNTYSVTFFTAMPPGLGCCEKATLSEGGMLPKSNMDVAKKQHRMLPKRNMDVAKKQHGVDGGGRNSCSAECRVQNAE